MLVNGRRIGLTRGVGMPDSPPPAPVGLNGEVGGELGVGFHGEATRMGARNGNGVHACDHGARAVITEEATGFIGQMGNSMPDDRVTNGGEEVDGITEWDHPRGGAGVGFKPLFTTTNIATFSAIIFLLIGKYFFRVVIRAIKAVRSNDLSGLLSLGGQIENIESNTTIATIFFILSFIILCLTWYLLFAKIFLKKKIKIRFK